MPSTSTDVISTGEFVARRKLTWKIENFDEIRRSIHLVLAQQIQFNVGTDVGFPTEWRCFLIPRIAENEIDTKGVGIFLCLENAPQGDKDVVASFQVGINKTNDFLPPAVQNFMTNGKLKVDDCGYKDFIKPETSSEDILVSGSLLIEVDVKVYSVAKVNGMTLNKKEKRYNAQFAKKLREDMEKLIMEPVKNCDSETKIFSKDGEEFSVVRAILSARSPVFQTMFQADMEESKTGIIRITDLSSGAISVILHFIYTGRLREEWKSTLVLPEIMYAAGKYQLTDLLAFLDEVSGQVCSKENAGRLVGHARKLGLKNAEKDLVEFMMKNMSSLDDIINFAEECTISNHDIV